jgi:hypothetical protein
VGRGRASLFVISSRHPSHLRQPIAVLK